MKLTLIGIGNVGTNLSAAFQKAGHEVQQLSGRNFVPQEVRGDVVVVCVKDDVIRNVVETMADSRRLIVHTAGSKPMDILSTPRRGVLYPMQTFSKSRLIDFDDIPLFIEAENEEDLKLLEQLATSISRHVYPLDSQRRKFLHLAAVFACNFTNHCYNIAAEILKKSDIPFNVMLPLIDETARKVHNLTPREAQTGPAVRFDEGVIRNHENMLTDDVRDLYRLMSKSIHKYHDKL